MAFLLIGIVIAGSIAYGTFGVKETMIDEEGNPIDVIDDGCQVAPTVSVVATDALSPDTTVSVGSAYRVNGKYLGYTYTNPAKGDKVEILVNASNYIDTALESFTVECKANNRYAEVYATAAPTITILEDSTTLTDAATGGAANLTALGAGSSETATLRIKGASKKSTSDLIFVVELSSVQNVSDVIVTDASGKELVEVDMPSFYANTLSSPYTKAFLIPAKLNGVQSEYTLDISAKTDKTVTGAVYTTVYGSQSAVDKNGAFLESAIENSNGDTKYEFTADYDFFINA